MMPALDGFGLLRELRAASQTRDVPVLLLSARAGEESRIEGLQAGANDYLVKPFSARELVARVEAQLLRAEVHAVEESHNRRLATIFAHAPVAIAILKGPQHVFEFANESYLQLVGRRHVIGKTVREMFPELQHQGIYELLDSVYTTGTPFLSDSLRLQMHRGPEGALEDGLLQVRLPADAGCGRRDRRHRDRRDRSHRGGKRQARCRSRESSEGRVPGDAGTRAAESAGADPDGAPADVAARRGGRDPEGTRRHRSTSASPGASGRRPAGCLADRARQDRAVAGARRAVQHRRAGGGDGESAAGGAPAQPALAHPSNRVDRQRRRRPACRRSCRTS